MNPQEVPQIAVVAAVIEDNGKYLITKRASHAVLPGYWEFPGGKVENGESDETALCRELKERLGVAIEVIKLIGENHHNYVDYKVALRLYDAVIKKGTPSPLKCHSFEWVYSKDLNKYEFPPADKKNADKLLGKTTTK